MSLMARAETKEWEIVVAPTFVNVAEDLLVVSTEDQLVRLQVAVKPSASADATSIKASCRFDLSGLGVGIHQLSVQEAEVSLPDGVFLLTSVHPTITVRLEDKASKSVDILAELEGQPASGFVVAAVRLKPDRIRLAGTAAMLEGVDNIKTRPINLEGASESFKKEVPLNLPEAIIVEPRYRIVVAEVEIGQRQITRLFENIPIMAKGNATGYRIEPKGITLTISGPEAIVSQIESNPAFSVTIDLAGLTAGSHSLKAAIKLPLHTTLVHVSPELFSVTISQ